MEEKDFQRISQMVAQIVDSRLEQMSTGFDSKLEQMSTGIDSKLEQMSTGFDLKLEQMSAGFDLKLEQMSAGFDSKLERHKEEILKEFDHQTTLQTEQFHKAMAIVAEGHQMLAEKIDRIELRLERKIDSIAEQLDAHRCDTKAHGGAYRVMEE